MPDSADPLPTQPSPDPDMPPRKPLAGGGGKLKKPLTDKQRAAAEQSLSHLRAHLVLRPLESPAAGARALPPPQEAALDALGLLNFFRLDLQSEAPRPDLIAPLVAYYDPACKRSFVRGVRVSVSRHDLTRALCLPPKPASAAPAPADVDPAAVVPAVMRLLQDYVLLPFQGDDMCILPQEVAAAEQAVREGAAHRVDWGGLIWGLVEKEMLELPKREDGVCYYGPHLQWLIYAQKPHLLELVEEGPVPEVSADVHSSPSPSGPDSLVPVAAHTPSSRKKRRHPSAHRPDSLRTSSAASPSAGKQHRALHLLGRNAAPLPSPSSDPTRAMTKGQSLRASWSFNYEKGLLDILHDHNHERFKGQNGWSPEGWRSIIKHFNEKFPSAGFSKSQIQDKEKDIKGNYKAIRAGIQESGVGWNDSLCMINALPDKWKKFIDDHPRLKKFQAKAFPLYHECEKLYEGSIATGELNFTSTEPLELHGPSSTQALFRYPNSPPNFTMQKEDSSSHQNVGTYMEY